MNNTENKNEELDIIQLINLFTNWISRVAKSFVYSLISLILYLKKGIYIWGSVLLIFVVYKSIFTDTSKISAYSSSIIVESKFNSTDILYSKINYFNKLLSKLNYEEVAKEFNIPKDISINISRIDIEPIKGDIEVEKIITTSKEIDKVKLNEITELYKKNRDEDYRLQKITIRSYTEEKNFYERILNSLIKSCTNKELESEREIFINNIETQITSLKNLFDKNLTIILGGGNESFEESIKLNIESKKEILEDISKLNMKLNRYKIRGIIHKISDFTGSEKGLVVEIPYIDFSLKGFLLGFIVLLAKDFFLYIRREEKKRLNK